MNNIYARALAADHAFNAPNNRTDTESDELAERMEQIIEKANRTPPASGVERAKFLDMLIETGSFDSEDLVALRTLRESALVN